MKKSFTLLACLTFSTAMFLSVSAMAANTDPLLTNKSTATFDLDLGGLTVALPIELRERAVTKITNNDQTELSIGNIDFSYEIDESIAGPSKKLNGWVEFEGGSARCDVEKNIEAIRKKSLTTDIKGRIQRVVNSDFDGYVVTTETSNKGKFKGLYLEVYNKKISVCYTISLAIGDFEGATRSEIRTALSPLTAPIKKSLIDYSLKGAAQ